MTATERHEDPWWQVDFGRFVDIDKVVVQLGTDLPADGAPRPARFTFSDDRFQPIELQPTTAPQTFTCEAHATSFLRLVAMDPTAFRVEYSLVEVEVWGRDRVPVATDLADPVR